MYECNSFYKMKWRFFPLFIVQSLCFFIFMMALKRKERSKAPVMTSTYIWLFYGVLIKCLMCVLNDRP